MLIQQVPWLDTSREHKSKRTHHVLRRAIAFLTSSSLQGSWAREVSQTKHSPKERGLGELEEAHTPVSKRSHHLDHHHHDQDHHYCNYHQAGRTGTGRPWQFWEAATLDELLPALLGHHRPHSHFHHHRHHYRPLRSSSSPFSFSFSSPSMSLSWWSYRTALIMIINYWWKQESWV